ncbi:NAD(P)H-dependent oxidoreductase [Halomicronema sp. CCY15110]|uniref:NAD(P)H-dependent oxidoreductase n=1 Tax=Halomicronema sp. CCY15110 TaxID=2767773 RepID=UPI00194F3380|nr:NAD(P)H-dependent oxidoreductase [Halomicronema sp. CCY15110]
MTSTSPAATAPLDASQVLQQLHWRYATKKFDPARKIPAHTWHALEQSLVLAPSSFGLQPWKFFVIRNPEIRQQLQGAAWGQSQVVDASHLVVLAIKQDVNAGDVAPYLDRMADVRQTAKENLQGLENMIKGFLKEPPFPLDPNAWSARQVYIALGFFLYSAAMLGVDACPMEGFVPAQVNEILGLPEQGYGAVVLCAAGYRAADDKYADMAKVRFQTEEVVQYID